MRNHLQNPLTRRVPSLQIVVITPAILIACEGYHMRYWYMQEAGVPFHLVIHVRGNLYAPPIGMYWHPHLHYRGTNPVRGRVTPPYRQGQWRLSTASMGSRCWQSRTLSISEEERSALDR
jgi:hypothetical protein